VPSPPAQYNETTEEGVCYIPHPPDLRREPPVEPYKTKHAEDLKPAQDIRSLLKKSEMGGIDGTFEKEEAHDWLALKALHEEGRLHANALPRLPHTQSVPVDRDSARWVSPGERIERTFEGTPRLLLPMLKDMMRFRRPLITWDIFEAEAPATWPNPLDGGTSGRFGAQASSAPQGAKRPKRAPAEANSVEHMLYKSAERTGADRELLNKRWAEELPGHVGSLEDGSFYVVRLEQGTNDEPWMAMGVVQVRKEQGRQTFLWLGRSSQGTNPWPTTVTFKPWPGPGTRQARATADMDEVICKITPEWLPKDYILTDGGAITINSEFRKRLELFGRLNGLVDDDRAHVAKPPRGPRAANETCPSAPTAATCPNKRKEAPRDPATQPVGQAARAKRQHRAAVPPKGAPDAMVAAGGASSQVAPKRGRTASTTSEAAAASVPAAVAAAPAPPVAAASAAVPQVPRRSATLKRPGGDPDQVTHLRKTATISTAERHFFEGLGLVDDTLVVIVQEETVGGVELALVDDLTKSGWGRGWVKAAYLSDFEEYTVTPDEASGRMPAKWPKVADPRAKSLGVGETVQACDKRGKWLPGRIIGERGDGKEREVLVHFRGYNQKWDEWLAVGSGKVDKAAPVGVEDGGAKVHAVYPARPDAWVVGR
jgi:hypothetical protein